MFGVFKLFDVKDYPFLKYEYALYIMMCTEPYYSFFGRNINLDKDNVFPKCIVINYLAFVESFNYMLLFCNSIYTTIQKFGVSKFCFYYY